MTEAWDFLLCLPGLQKVGRKKLMVRMSLGTRICYITNELNRAGKGENLSKSVKRTADVMVAVACLKVRQ
jgi:hypothetical protein